MDGQKLTFEDDALDLFVDTAMHYALGARGLRSILETVMTELMFYIS